MESINSAAEEPQTKIETELHEEQDLSDQWFSEKFEALLPKIQERWPSLAKQTLEATRGSFDELVRVISQDSGITSHGVQKQLEELFNSATDRSRDLAESLEPLERQLEELLDELNSNLRPRIEKPIRKKPLLAIGIAAGIGLVMGIILSGGRRS